MLPSWSQIKEAPERISSRARSRARRVRDNGQERWWQVRTDALRRAGGLLDRADEWPAVGRLAGAVGGLVDRELERLISVPVEGWNELNARDAIKASRELNRTGLLAAREHESSTRNRKTVLRAIDDRLGRAASAEAAPQAV